MKSSNGQRLYIQEVAPRDVFQIESRFVPTERALDCRVDEFNLVMCASETHNASNLRMNCEQSLTQFAQSAKLNQADIPNKKAHTAKDAAEDPQYRARGMVQEIDDPALGNVLHVPEGWSHDRSR